MGLRVVRLMSCGRSYSFQAEHPVDGKTIEFDAISKKGVITDNKEFKSIEQRWLDFQKQNTGKGGPPDVYEQMTRTGAAQRAPSRTQFNRMIRGQVKEKGDQATRQSQFIEHYRLPPAEWQVPDAEWKELLDAELMRRGITNVQIVVHE
jgi:hypothetical protein